MSQQDRFDSPCHPGGEQPSQGVVIDLQRASAKRYPPPRRRGLVNGSRDGWQQYWSVREDAPEYRKRPAVVDEAWPDEGSLMVLAMPTGRAFMEEAVRAGATFYVLRDAGEIAALLAGRRPSAPRAAPPDPLTRRQRDVLRQVALGRATKEIAYQLRLSPKTVAAHRAHIMERLGLRDVAALVVYALRRGIVELDEYGESAVFAPGPGRRGRPRR